MIRNMRKTTNIEQSAELCIGALSQAVLDDVARYLKLKGKAPDILAFTAELRMDIVFILMDLGVSYVACCKTKVPYACRYHIKNLYASMQEAYKLLLGYGNSQQFTIWTKIRKAIDRKPVRDWEEQPQLKARIQAISDKLNVWAGDDIDKTHRELTYHYDADMKQVYLYTVETNSLEEAGYKYISYLELLTEMIKLCDDIEYCLQKKGITTAIEIESTPIDNSLHLTLIQYLSKNKKLPVVLEGILNDVKPIDDYALHLEKFNKINELTNNQIELPEIDNVFVMLNMYLTVMFMRADMAAITQSLLLSKTNGEAMLNMRRYVITITAAFGHLYGYSENKRPKSIWSSVLGMIPEDAEDLKKKAIQINGLLLRVVLRKDMDVRTCYAHLYDNKTRKTNIPSIVDLLKNQNPILELQKVTLILKVTKLVMGFMKEVMEELSKRAHDANEKSNIELRNTLLKIKSLSDIPNCPIELREMFYGMIEKARGWTGIELLKYSHNDSTNSNKKAEQLARF